MPYQRLRYERPQYIGIIVAICGTLTAWGLSLAGFFDILNHPLHDALTRLSPIAVASSTSLLLVDSAPKDGEAGVWLRLLEQLESHQPNQVIFTAIPTNASPEFYEVAKGYGNVLIGRKLIRPNESGGTALLESLPPTIPRDFDGFGIVDSPPARYGVYRHQHSSFELKGRRHPALEAAAWSSRMGQAVARLGQPYRINFRGGLDHLPRVAADRVLAGGLVPELVKGRSVIVAADSTPYRTGYFTPLSPHQAVVSSLQYHGFALETLLSGTEILVPGDWVTLGMLLVVVVANLFLYQWMDMRLSSCLTLGLMMLYVGAGWAVLTYMYLWIPISEILIVQMGVFLLVLRENFVVRELSLQKMTRYTSAQLQERAIGTSFFTSTEPWNQVMEMLVQTLDLNRLILLDRVPGDHRLREVVAWQCSLDDIDERRRDYHRTPYSTAIKERGLTKTEDRNFFTISTTNESQYLMPLTVSGDVLGFLAFGIEPEAAAAIPKFKTVIEEFGNQIATLLSRRQQWLAYHTSEDHQSLQRYLQLEGGGRVYRELDKSVIWLSQRLARLENVFAHLGVATVVYNLFGNVLQVNRRMVQCLTDASLPPYDLSILDLIVRLCEVDSGEARRVMRRLILEKDTVALPASVSESPEQTHVLQLRPIVHSDADETVNAEDAYPFQIMGIVCELIDVTDLNQMHKLKIQLIERIYMQIRGDLSSLINDMSALEQDVSIDPQRQRVTQVLMKIANNFISILDKSSHILNVDISKSNAGIYPINIKDLIEICLKTYDHDERLNDIAFRTHLPTIESLGFASPIELKYAVRAMIDFLIEDTVVNGDIVIAVHEQGDEVYCSFSNTGFGMPSDRLQAYLAGAGDSDSEKLIRLRHTVQYIQNWGGAFEARSEIGTGTRFQIKLRGFK